MNKGKTYNIRQELNGDICRLGVFFTGEKYIVSLE